MDEQAIYRAIHDAPRPAPRCADRLKPRAHLPLAPRWLTQTPTNAMSAPRAGPRRGRSTLALSASILCTLTPTTQHYIASMSIVRLQRRARPIQVWVYRSLSCRQGTLRGNLPHYGGDPFPLRSSALTGALARKTLLISIGLERGPFLYSW